MITSLDYYFFLKKFDDFYKGNQRFIDSLRRAWKMFKDIVYFILQFVNHYRLSFQSKLFSQWEVIFPYSTYVLWRKGFTSLFLHWVKIQRCRYFMVKSHNGHWALTFTASDWFPKWFADHASHILCYLEYKMAIHQQEIHPQTRQKSIFTKEQC